MKFRKFGKTDLLVSEKGFGAWAIGGDAVVGNTPIGWGPADDKTSIEAIRTAMDAGVNFFDTADFYGLGHSEDLLGKELGSNGNIIIATKVGHRNIADKILLDYSKDYILQACEASLKRLNRDRIDFYQLHSARMQHLEQSECIEAMELLKQQGKVRYWGLSLNTFYPDAEAEYLMKNDLGDGFQLVFNLINQKATNVIEKASSKGYGIIARMPLQFGLLTGKFGSNTVFSPKDHRSFRLTPQIMHETISILDKKIWPVAQRLNLSKTELALNFILSFSGISTVITGIRSAEQAKQNNATSQQLDENTVTYLQSLYEKEWKPLMDLMEKQG
jgi:aryl-alcohol dehydrogenase-like predicted oxidoreductase